MCPLTLSEIIGKDSWLSSLPGVVASIHELIKHTALHMLENEAYVNYYIIF